MLVQPSPKWTWEYLLLNYFNFKKYLVLLWHFIYVYHYTLSIFTLLPVSFITSKGNFILFNTQIHIPCPQDLRNRQSTSVSTYIWCVKEFYIQWEAFLLLSFKIFFYNLKFPLLNSMVWRNRYKFLSSAFSISKIAIIKHNSGRTKYTIQSITASWSIPLRRKVDPTP